MVQPSNPYDIATCHNNAHHQCSIVHACAGHGSSTFLSFEDSNGALHPVTVPVLRDLIQAGSSQAGVGVELAFVSACSSAELGHAFVEAGVPHVIAVRDKSEVMDTAASLFTQAFYMALATGSTIAASFEIAKQVDSCAPPCHPLPHS